MLLDEGIDSVKTEECILIMPSISVGNVGQLAIDLLISNLNLKYVGRVNAHDCTLPVVGSDPFGGDQLCSSFMAYYNSKLRLLVFHQRSDFLREKKQEYLRRLVSWLKESNFRAVFLLTSAFSYGRTDEQMALNPLQYRATPAADKYLSNTSVDSCIATRMPWNIQEKNDGNTERVLPGSGIAQALYEKCVTANLPLIVVSKYCMEGDNKIDGGQVASACAGLLGLPEVPKKWTLPISWNVPE